MYIAVYKQLAAELLKTMDADGNDSFWHASLLNGSGYPVPETSGTASFAYGQGQFHIISAFSIEIQNKVGVYVAIRRISVGASSSTTGCCRPLPTSPLYRPLGPGERDTSISRSAK